MQPTPKPASSAAGHVGQSVASRRQAHQTSKRQAGDRAASRPAATGSLRRCTTSTAPRATSTAPRVTPPSSAGRAERRCSCAPPAGAAGAVASPCRRRAPRRPPGSPASSTIASALDHRDSASSGAGPAAGASLLVLACMSRLSVGSGAPGRSQPPSPSSGHS